MHFLAELLEEKNLYTPPLPSHPPEGVKSAGKVVKNIGFYEAALLKMTGSVLPGVTKGITKLEYTHK